MLMVPASLILAGSLATRAASTVGALAEVVADAELELPEESESEPQAVRARAVVAMAATARARVRNMGVLSRGCAGAGAASARCTGPIRPPPALVGPTPVLSRSCPMAASPHVPFFDPESPVFRAHEGGKLGVHATKPLRDRDDLALLYTPGVAEVSLAIAADPSLSTRYTARGNTVAVISDGTAVLGLGDIGPLG